MTITIACPSCKKPLVVPDNKTGATVACPSCKAHLRVAANGQVSQDGNTATRPVVLPFPSASSPAKPAPPRTSGPPHSCNDWNEVDAHLGQVVEIIDRQLTGQEEAQVRGSLTSYANVIPHHKLQGLGQQITISKVQEFRAYRIVLDSLFEKRSIARKVEPFQGGSVPPPKTTEQNIQVWSYPYATASDFRKGTKEHVVEDSKGVRPCQQCGGQKTAACGGCSGTGGVACSKCRGSGTVQCPECKGKKEKTRQVGVQQRQQHCAACTGGWSNISNGTCKICNGTAIVFEDVPLMETGPCPTCYVVVRSMGVVDCGACQGKAKVSCSKCTGTGKVACTTCQGKGQMLSFLCVVQSFEPLTETILVPCAAMKDQAITSMVQHGDYSPVLTLTTTTVPATLNLTSGTEAVRAGIKKAFDAALARSSKDARLTRQQLQAGAASILEVVYEHEGKSYTAWFVGRQSRLHAPVNPVTDALKVMVQEAVDIWTKGDQKEAAARLNEIVKMTKAHPSCQAAYDEMKGAIPTDLAAKANWMKWRPWLIGGGIAVAVVLALCLLVNIILWVFVKPGQSRQNAPPGFQQFEKPGGDHPKFK